MRHPDTTMETLAQSEEAIERLARAVERMRATLRCSRIIIESLSKFDPRSRDQR